MRGKNVSGMRTIRRWHDRPMRSARESHILARVCPAGTPAITRNKRQRFGFHRVTQQRLKSEIQQRRGCISLPLFEEGPRCPRGSPPLACPRSVSPRERFRTFDWNSYGDRSISNRVIGFDAFHRPSENRTSPLGIPPKRDLPWKKKSPCFSVSFLPRDFRNFLASQLELYIRLKITLVRFPTRSSANRTPRKTWPSISIRSILVPGSRHRDRYK